MQRGGPDAGMYKMMSSGRYQSVGGLPTKSVLDVMLTSNSVGTSTRLRHFRYGNPGARPRVYLHAGLHADEIPGMLVLHQLMRLLDNADAAKRVRGEIIIIPAANPIGLSQWGFGHLQGWFESAEGVNFNRGYPELVEEIARKVKNTLTDDAEENTELIRTVSLQALADLPSRGCSGHWKHHLLKEALKSDFVLDLHCDDEAVTHLYTSSASWPELSDLAAQLRAELVLLERVSGGNPFDEACSLPWSELANRFPPRPILQGCHAATIELRGTRDVDHAYASADSANLFRFLQRRKAVAGNPGTLPELVRPARPLSGVEQLCAPAPGIVVFRKKPGDWVKSGETVFELIDQLKEDPRSAVQEICAGTDGLLFAHRSDRMARPGLVFARISGKKKLRGKDGMLLTP